MVDYPHDEERNDQFIHLQQHRQLQKLQQQSGKDTIGYSSRTYNIVSDQGDDRLVHVSCDSSRISNYKNHPWKNSEDQEYETNSGTHSRNHHYHSVPPVVDDDGIIHDGVPVQYSIVRAKTQHDEDREKMKHFWIVFTIILTLGLLCIGLGALLATGTHIKIAESFTKPSMPDSSDTSTPEQNIYNFGFYDSKNASGSSTTFDGSTTDDTTEFVGPTFDLIQRTDDDRFDYDNSQDDRIITYPTFFDDP